MSFIFSARSSADAVNTSYASLDEHLLTATVISADQEGADSTSGIKTVTVSFTNSGSHVWEGVIKAELKLAPVRQRFFLPGFMYGTNKGHSPLRHAYMYPRMRPGNCEQPASSWWMIRADRLSHPCAVAFGDGSFVGLSTSPYVVKDKNGELTGWEPGTTERPLQYNGYSCSIGDDEKGGTVGFTLGYENAPWLFVSSANIQKRPSIRRQSILLHPGETISVAVDLFDVPAKDETELAKILEHVYKRFHQSPRTVGSPEKAVSDLSSAIFKNAWLPKDHMYAGFVFDIPSDLATRLDDSDHTYQKLGSSSWTNGLSAAAPMLASAIRLGNEEMRAQALECINDIVLNSANPHNNLPFDAVNDGIWSNQGWWFDGLPVPGHSSYLVGQALYYILVSYENEKTLKKVEHPEWLSFCKKALSTVAVSQNGDGEFPYIFSEKTGAGLEYDSFAGAWCMAACAKYQEVTGDSSFEEVVWRAEQHYYNDFVARMECYGAPLDTSKAVDSEGILAYIKTMKALHQIYKEPKYLDRLRVALDYEFTFKFCWNTPITVPPLSKVGWTSCGGSITSTCNPHIHPMSSNVIGEMQYYLNNRDDGYVESRLKDTVLWSTQTYNTYAGEYDYGDIGWMSERFCYSQGLLEETYPADGSPASTWLCLMPWAIGSILDGLTGTYWDTRVSRSSAQ